MIALDDELSRLGDVTHPDPSTRASARVALLDRAAPSAAVAPFTARPRHRRRLVRAATAGIAAAAAATAVTMLLPDDGGVVSIRPASAEAQLEQAATQAEQAPALDYPVRLTLATRTTGAVPTADDCVQYVFSVGDSVHDCEGSSDGLQMLAASGTPGPQAAIAFAANPDAAKAELDRQVAANVDQRRRTGNGKVGAGAVKIELIAGALGIPQMDGSIRSMLLRELMVAPDLRAEAATTAAGATGTRFTATYPHGASIAVTIDEAGYVRETTYETLGLQLDEPAATTTVTLSRPEPAGELPAEVAAVRAEIDRRFAEIEADFEATAPLQPSDTSMTYVCSMINPPEDLPVRDGTRLVVGVHCFNPAAPNR